MFGYIRPSVPDLRVREHAFYRAAYCGCCRAMRKTTGSFSGAALSYDAVFLALVRVVAGHEHPADRQRRCIAHPLRRRPVLESTPALVYTARASAILADAKAADDCADEHGARRLRARLARLVTRPAKRRARLPELAENVNRQLRALADLEASGGTVDALADAFGNLLGDVFSFGSAPIDRDTLSAIGFYLGRFIYVCDAVDDFAADAARGTFNPLTSLAADGVLPDGVRASLADGMNNDLYNLGNALSELDFSGYATVWEILSNIVSIGLPARVRAITKPHSTTGDTV